MRGGGGYADPAMSDRRMGRFTGPSGEAAPGTRRAVVCFMPNEILRSLTMAAAHGTIAMVDSLPRTMAFFKIGGQLFDSGTSQAANYRAAHRAQSTRALIAKLKIVEEESDESEFWIDCLFVAKLPPDLHTQARVLQGQFNQITRMTVAAIKTCRTRLKTESEKGSARFRA
jgi:four helix bundle protein